MNEKPNKIASFLKGGAMLMLSNCVLKAINFFLLPLYTNNLTPQMMGVSETVTTLTGFVYPLLVMGLDSAYSAFYFEEGDKERSEKVYSTLSFAFFLLGIIPFVTFLFSDKLSIAFFGSEEYTVIIRLAMATVSFNIWYLPLSLEIRMQNKMGLFSIYSIEASLLMILLNILFVSILKAGEYSLILSAFIVHAVQIVILACFVRKLPKRRFIDTKLFVKMLKFALPMVPALVMDWVLSGSDKYVLLYFHGNDSVGVYSIALKLVTVMNVIISAMFTAYSPFAFSSKDDENAKGQFKLIFNMFSLALLFISFTAAVFGKEIIKIMAAPEYSSAYTALRDLMFAQAIYGMGTILGYGAYFAKKSKYSFYAVSAAATVNLLLNIVFIPKYGIQAAAATTLLGYCINTIIMYVLAQRVYPCDYGVGKIFTVCISIYVVSIVMQEAALVPKLIAWIICVCVVTFAFRKLLKTVFVGLAGMLGAKRGVKDEE